GAGHGVDGDADGGAGVDRAVPVGDEVRVRAGPDAVPVVVGGEPVDDAGRHAVHPEVDRRAVVVVRQAVLEHPRVGLVRIGAPAEAGVGRVVAQHAHGHAAPGRAALAGAEDEPGGVVLAGGRRPDAAGHAAVVDQLV